MKKIFLLCSLMFIFSCAKDDAGDDSSANPNLTVTIVSVQAPQATISWTLSNENGQTLYRILLEGEVIEEAFSGNQYTFSDIQNETDYNGILFAISQDGDETFQNFSFTTKGSLNFNGSIRLNTQAQVDNFRYTSVSGSVSIGEFQNSNITNLAGLSRLTSVQGLNIIYNEQLQSLNGLENLSNATKLIVSSNPLLSDVSALSGINPGFSEVTIRYNPSLVDLNGINVMSNANFILIEDSGVQNVDAFSNVQTLRSLRLLELPNLNSVEGLSNLEMITENLLISELPNLSSFDGFNKLQAFPTDIAFRNIGVTNFEGFNQVVSAKEIRIIQCENLLSLSGFDSLEIIDAFRVVECPNLNDTGNFENLTTINGSLSLSDLPSLTTLSGFSNLSYVRSIGISYANALTSLEGLNSLTGGANQILSLQHLNQLEDVSALANWEGNLFTENYNLSYGVRIINLPSLTSLNGLNFEKMNVLELKGLPSLKSLEGLEELTRLRELIIYNVSISDLTGLTNLTYVHRTYIDQCRFLVNLDGTNLTENLDVTNSFKARIYINTNMNLSDYCGITQYAASIPFNDLFVSTSGNQYNVNKTQIRSQTECSQ